MTKNKEPRRYWLMKSEPDAYSWDDLVAEGEGTWDGVRNHLAKLNMMKMKKGDTAFYVDIEFDVLRTEPVIPEAELRAGPLSEHDWWPNASATLRVAARSFSVSG